MRYVADYYTEYFREYCKYLKSFRDWNTLVIAILSMTFGAVYYLVKHGVKDMGNQIESFIAFTLAPLIAVAFVFIIWGLIRTAPKIFHLQSLELEKYKWNSVLTKTDIYSMMDGTQGWAIKIKNNKSIPIKGFFLTAVEISSKGKLVFSRSNKLAWFGYIYTDDGYTREKIVFPSDINLNAKKGVSKFYSQTLESGREYTFVLTKMLNEDYQCLYTSHDPINVVPRNIVIKLSLSCDIEDKNERYRALEKIIEIMFDSLGKPKILS